MTKVWYEIDNTLVIIPDWQKATSSRAFTRDNLGCIRHLWYWTNNTSSPFSYTYGLVPRPTSQIYSYGPVLPRPQG